MVLLKIDLWIDFIDLFNDCDSLYYDNKSI